MWRMEVPDHVRDDRLVGEAGLPTFVIPAKAGIPLVLSCRVSKQAGLPLARE